MRSIDYIQQRVAMPIGRKTILPSRYKNTEHCYQALPAWSADGRKLLYIGFDDTSRCDIVVRDVTSGEETAIASTKLFDFHTAAWQHWALQDNAVLYRGQDQFDLSPPLLVSVETPHKVEPVPALCGCLIRQVINEGRTAVYYRWPTDSLPAEAGFYNLESGETNVLFGPEEAINGLTHGEKPEAGSVEFQHVVANADGSRVFFKMLERRENAGDSLSRSFNAYNVRTGKFTDFGPLVSGHPEWLDDRHIVNVQSPRDGSDGRWLVLMDAETGEFRRLVDLPIEGPGHPAVSPDGRWLATDAFTVDEKLAILYLMDLQTGYVRELHRFSHPRKTGPGYNPKVITRAHPHPTWAPDSKSLLTNTIIEEYSLRLTLWEDFLTA